MPSIELSNPGVVEQGIAAVVNAYEGLQEELGFRFTVVKVWRHLIDPESLDDVDSPCIFVVRPPGSTGTVEWYDERAYKETLTLHVLGYISGNGEDPEDQGLATRGEALLSDIKKLQIADPSFGVPNVVKNSKIVADTNDAAFDSPGAVVGIAMELIVFWDGNSNP